MVKRVHSEVACSPAPRAAAGEIPLTVTFEYLCSYLAELTLLEYPMLNYLPSTVAASCVSVALYILFHAHPNCRTWSNTLTHYSGYLPRDLHHCAQVGTGWACGRGCLARTHPLTGQNQPCRPPHAPPLCPPVTPQAVHQLFVQAKTSNLPAAREKYAQPKFAQVSSLGCPTSLPDWMFL